MNPNVVTLCGSTKFKKAFMDANFSETMAGHIVLSVGGFDHADGVSITEEQRNMLAELHRQKISMSYEILVINVGGYIGESTRSEIEYAQTLGKRIRYLED